MANDRGKSVRPEDQVVRLRTPREVQEVINSGTSFDAMLFRLMQKADQSNWKKLSRAFPVQATEFYRWLHTGSLKDKLGGS